MNQNYLNYLALKLSDRLDITVIDLDVLAKLLRVNEIENDFLPTADLSKGTLKDQRKARFELAENLWRKERQFWLDLEATWLKDMRETTGSSQDDGKDDYQDVVSVLILTTIYTIVFDYYLFTIGKLNATELTFALESANLSLKTVILKGVTRSTVVDGNNLYNTIRETGLRVGGSGKYLPDPAKNLPQLLTFFLPENISPDIYKK